MRKSFVTGLMLILPIVITFILVYFVFNVVTKPFIGPIEEFLTTTDLFGYAEHHQSYLALASRMIVLIFLVFFTTFVGLCAQLYWVHIIGNMGETLIDRIPFVNKVYRAARDAVKILFRHNESELKFGKVVLVPYPSKEMKSIGFLSNEAMAEGSDEEHLGLVSVFVAGSPNPSLGFLLMYHRDEIEYLDMSVEEGLKFVISLGVVCDKTIFTKRRKFHEQ